MARRRKFQKDPNRPINAPRPSMGVRYFELQSAPGLQVFECTRLKATMAQTGCASRWRKAQVAEGVRGEEFEACRSCPIGADHAGEEHVHHSSLFGVMICPRCGKGTMRMIHGLRCVSCYNREREVAVGRDARGNVPVGLIQNGPRRREFRIRINGRAERRRVDCKGLFEPIFHALRTMRGEVEFGFQGPTVGMRQGRLF